VTSFSDQPAEASAKDSYVDSTNPTNNYGTAAILDMDSGDEHTFIEFDLSSIPAGATCDSATLSLWSAESATAVAYDIYSLHSNVSTWTEAGITWNNYKAATAWPGSGGGSTSGTDYEADASPPTITFPASSIDTEAQADLTSGNNLTAARIAGWFGAANTNYGLVIGVTGATGTRSWHSSSVATAGYRPKITVTYTAGAVQAMRHFRSRRT
jgi:hypothetical protein